MAAGSRLGLVDGGATPRARSTAAESHLIFLASPLKEVGHSLAKAGLSNVKNHNALTLLLLVSPQRPVTNMFRKRQLESRLREVATTFMSSHCV